MAGERSKVTTQIEKGWLFASDDVLEASYAYLNIFDKLCCPPEAREPLQVEAVISRIKSDPAIRKDLSEALAVIFRAMREDIRRDTSITDEWAKQHLQFYRWGALAGFK